MSDGRAAKTRLPGGGCHDVLRELPARNRGIFEFLLLLRRAPARQSTGRTSRSKTADAIRDRLQNCRCMRRFGGIPGRGFDRHPADLGALGDFPRPVGSGNIGIHRGVDRDAAGASAASRGAGDASGCTGVHAVGLAPAGHSSRKIFPARMPSLIPWAFERIARRVPQR